jgi:hypothetical protein
MPCRFFIDVHIAEHRPVLGFAFPVLHAAAINFSRIRLGKCFTVHPADAVGERVNIEPLALQSAADRVRSRNDFAVLIAR